MTTAKQRPEASRHTRNLALGAAAGIGAVAAAGFAILRFGLFDRLFAPSEGHAAPDLAADAPPPGSEGRAPVDFRPDPTAPVSAAEREALRPATGPGPSLTELRGSMNSQTAPAIS